MTYFCWFWLFCWRQHDNMIIYSFYVWFFYSSYWVLPVYQISCLYHFSIKGYRGWLNPNHSSWLWVIIAQHARIRHFCSLVLVRLWAFLVNICKSIIFSNFLQHFLNWHPNTKFRLSVLDVQMKLWVGDVPESMPILICPMFFKIRFHMNV